MRSGTLMGVQSWEASEPTEGGCWIPFGGGLRHPISWWKELHSVLCVFLQNVINFDAETPLCVIATLWIVRFPAWTADWRKGRWESATYQMIKCNRMTKLYLKYIRISLHSNYFISKRKIICGIPAMVHTNIKYQLVISRLCWHMPTTTSARTCEVLLHALGPFFQRKKICT